MRSGGGIDRYTFAAGSGRTFFSDKASQPVKRAVFITDAAEVLSRKTSGYEHPYGSHGKYVARAQASMKPEKCCYRRIAVAHQKPGFVWKQSDVPSKLRRVVAWEGCLVMETFQNASHPCRRSLSDAASKVRE